jgi:tetratricopeptide (TPR) repeat protein
MDLTKAANLLSKLIAWCRAQLAPILKPSKGSKLDDRQKNQMRNLAVTLATLGQVKRQQGLASDCLKHYQESLRFYQRIGESVGQAVTEGNVGNAYLSIPEIRDFSAAEAAFRRSLALRDTNDSLGKARSLEGIGLVNVERFSDGIDRKDSHEKLLHYALQAETNLLAALDLFPAGAINDRTRLHHQIGSLYARIGNLEGAAECRFDACFSKRKQGYRNRCPMQLLKTCSILCGSSLAEFSTVSGSGSK